MVKGFGMNCVKYTVVLSNAALCFLGILIMGTAIWANTNKEVREQLKELTEKELTGFNNYLEKYYDWFDEALWALAAFGLCISVVGFIACCGAWRENRGLLAMYFVIVLLLTLIGFGVVAGVLVAKPKMQEQADIAITTFFGNVKNKEYEENKGIMNNTTLPALENKLGCCGVDGSEERCTGLEKPSCLEAAFKQRSNVTEAEQKLEKLVDCCGIEPGLKHCEGNDKPDCKVAIMNVLSMGVTGLAVVCLLACLIMIFTMVFTCCLYVEVGNRSPYEKHH